MWGTVKLFYYRNVFEGLLLPQCFPFPRVLFHLQCLPRAIFSRDVFRWQFYTCVIFEGMFSKSQFTPAMFSESRFTPVICYGCFLLPQRFQRQFYSWDNFRGLFTLAIVSEGNFFTPAVFSHCHFLSLDVFGRLFTPGMIPSFCFTPRQYCR